MALGDSASSEVAKKRCMVARLCIKQEATSLRFRRPLPNVIATMNSSITVASMSAGLDNVSFSQPNLPQSWHSQITLPAIVEGWSTWQYAVTFVLGVIVYDQGKKRCLISVTTQLTFDASDVHQAKGLHRWSCVQDPTHGPVPSSTRSEVRLIPRSMGQWTSELRFGLP